VVVAAVAVAVVVVAVGVALVATTEYYRLYFEQYAKHLNKLIQEYE
jgi:hypothetical protein